MARCRARRCSAPAGPTQRRSSTRRRCFPGRSCRAATSSTPRSRNPISPCRTPMPSSARCRRPSNTTRKRSRPTTPSARASANRSARSAAGHLLDAAVKAGDDGRGGWFAQLATLPDSPESRYLYHLLAGNEFQEGLKNYRALDGMAKNLATWADNLGAFDDMVQTRKQAFDEKLPAADARLATVDVATINGRRDALQAEFEAAIASRDIYALATEAEREQLDMLDAVDCGARASRGRCELRRRAREGAPRARCAPVEARRRLEGAQLAGEPGAPRPECVGVRRAHARDGLRPRARGRAGEERRARPARAADEPARRRARGSRRQGQVRAGGAARRHRRPRARGPAQAPRRIFGPGALRARDDLRPRDRRTRRRRRHRRRRREPRPHRRHRARARAARARMPPRRRRRRRRSRT